MVYLANIYLCLFFLIATVYALIPTRMQSVDSNSLFRERISLTLPLAKLIAQACEEEAMANHWNVVISILDDGGNLVYLQRMDDCQIGSILVSQEKGMTAVRFKRPTKIFQELINGQEGNKGSTNMIGLPGCTPLEGGLPLIVDDQIIGGMFLLLFVIIHLLISCLFLCRNWYQWGYKCTRWTDCCSRMCTFGRDCEKQKIIEVIIYIVRKYKHVDASHVVQLHDILFFNLFF